MNNILNNIRKYPKSIKNFQCIGPCYYPGTTFIHPTQFNIIVNKEESICPVEPQTIIDPKTNKEIMISADFCFKPTHDKDIPPDELQLNMLNPNITFNLDQFIKLYYNIYSFEDGIDWIDKHKHVSIKTKIRIINSVLNIYGSNISIIDRDFIKFFIEYLTKEQITYIYKNLNQYITIRNNDFILTNKQNNLSINEYNIERTNYIIETLFVEEDLIQFLTKYFKNNKQYFTNNQYIDILNDMTNKFIEYTINRIKLL